MVPHASLCPAAQHLCGSLVSTAEDQLIGTDGVAPELADLLPQSRALPWCFHALTRLQQSSSAACPRGKRRTVHHSALRQVSSRKFVCRINPRDDNVTGEINCRLACTLSSTHLKSSTKDALTRRGASKPTFFKFAVVLSMLYPVSPVARNSTIMLHGSVRVDKTRSLGTFHSTIHLSRIGAASVTRKWSRCPCHHRGPLHRAKTGDVGPTEGTAEANIGVHPDEDDT